MQEQEGEQRALLRRSERERAVVPDRLDRSQDAEFDARDPSPVAPQAEIKRPSRWCSRPLNRRRSPHVARRSHHPASRLLALEPAGRQPARDGAAARPRRAVRRPRRRRVAVPGLAVRPGRQDPGRRARRRQGRRAPSGSTRRASSLSSGAPRDCSARPGCSTCSSRAAPTSSWRPFAAPLRHEPRAGPAYAGPVRILLVSQMYPGPDAPDLGTFVAQIERELVARGHEVELAVLDTRAGGKLRYLALARKARAASTPDVVYAHFLVPSGLHRRARGRRAARRHRAREGRPQHRRDSRRHRRDAPRREAGGSGDLRLRLPPARARDEAPRGAREDRGRLERRRPRALRGHRPAARARPASSASARSTSGRTSSASPTPSRASARER